MVPASQSLSGVGGRGGGYRVEGPTCSKPGMMSARSCSKESLAILSTTLVCILMAARLMG